MRKKETAVIDFGSQKITVAIGKLNSNDSLNILGSGEADYAGYMDGEFLEIDKLGFSIKQAITIAENNSVCQIGSIVIGVPATFCIAICKDVSQNFRKKIRINNKTIESLYDLGNDFSRFDTHKVISSVGINFELDDTTVVLDPLRCLSTRLKAKVSYILAEMKFIKLMEDIFKILGVKIDGYISCNLAQRDYLFKDKLNANECVIDCGHITTSVSIYNGNGVLSINEFSQGGGHITADLMKWLKLKYNAADILKRKAVLSVTPDFNEMYEIKVGNEFQALSMISTNQIIINRVEIIAKTINKCLDMNKQLIDDKTKFYLTGGGISYIKGAKDILGSVIGKSIDILVPSIPELARPHYSSVLSLLYSALKN